MMTRKTVLHTFSLYSLVLPGLLWGSSSAFADLHGRAPMTPGGTDYQAYYDDEQDITWVADGKLAHTNTFGLPTDTWLGPHPLDSALENGPQYSDGQIDSASGAMAWTAALHWIDAMNAANYLGSSSWRLPKVMQPDASCSVQHEVRGLDLIWGVVSIGEGCTGSEMGYLFNVYGLKWYASEPFTNFAPSSYWYREEAWFNPYVFAYEMHVGTLEQSYRSKHYPHFTLPVMSGDISDTIAEVCGNGIDDDSDGLLDDADPECAVVTPEAGLLVRCIHRPLWPAEGEPVSIRAETIDAEGNELIADTIEIYRTDPENPVGDAKVNSSMQLTVYPDGGRMRYGCRAEFGSEVAFSGWREVDIGTPEFTDIRAVPVIYNGPMDEKIDIVFIPEVNRHGLGAGAWDRFQEDIYRVIHEGIYSIPWFVANQREINFWLGRDMGKVTPGDPDDSSSKCKKEKPDGYRKGYGFADAAGLIHDQDCRDNAALSLFTTRFDPSRLQVVAHEIGHAAFTLSDEYTGAASLYFTVPDVPNLLPTHSKCRSAATERGFDPDQCRSLISDGASGFFLGGLWIFEPNYRNDEAPWTAVRDLMQQTGGEGECPSTTGGLTVCEARYHVGDSEITRMNWKVGKCRAGRC
ncbi:hypothetical protein [Haliea sp. E17]|uniref:hypothetical protein n=1 Tax=Haliea sp. E17 TaxID=3401576 RepID=UPI003AAF9A69